MKNPISIYIHFPYCIKKCNYCDFVSFECLDDIESLTNYYLKEIEYYSKFVSKRKVKTIYFGGGTPSLMPVQMIESIIEKICFSFDVCDMAEITIEVNPKTVTDKKLKSFKDIGINRLSVGIQSLDDDELKFLGRIHNSTEAIETINISKKYFDNISLDFIYGLPYQSFDDWKKSLYEIVKLDVKHLSLYQLIIEPKTPIYKMVKNNKIKPLDEDIRLKMFEYTNKFLKQYYPQYEISNYSKKDYNSKHNLNYWNGGDYLGIGVSAAGRISENGKFYETQNPKTVQEWKKNIEDNKFPIKNFSKVKKARELLIMGFRKNKGINFKEFKKNSLLDFYDVVDLKKLQNFIYQKFILVSKKSIKLSKKGINVIDAILREIII